MSRSTGHRAHLCGERSAPVGWMGTFGEGRHLSHLSLDIDFGMCVGVQEPHIVDMGRRGRVLQKRLAQTSVCSTYM